jgi:hypothetical protein
MQNLKKNMVDKIWAADNKGRRGDMHPVRDIIDW